MKTFLVSFVMLTSVAFGAETTLLKTKVSGSSSVNKIESRFVIDDVTGEGSVAVKVSRRQSGKPGAGGPVIYRALFNKTVKVEGLSLLGDKLVYAGEEGDVECGTLGESRVFKVPTIYLSGNCSIVSKIVKKELTVKLITK